MARKNLIQFRGVYSNNIQTTTKEKWEALISKPEFRGKYVLVKDLSELETISDPVPKPKNTKTKDSTPSEKSATDSKDQRRSDN